MAKVVIDTTGEQSRGTYTGPVPPKGLYRALLKRGWWTKSSTGKPMLKVLFVLEAVSASKKQFDGYPVFHNITYEASTKWKMHELFEALRAGEKAGIDYDEDNGNVTRIGKAVVGKTYVLIQGVAGMWNNEPRLEVGNLAPVPKPEGEDEDEEFTDEDEGDATAYEDAGGVEAVSTQSDGDADADPWAATSTADDDAPPF